MAAADYSPTTLSRLIAKVEFAPSGCWLFTGALDTSGYGLIGVGGSGNIGKAHRVIYEICEADIPAGMQVLHRCDVRNCVNTDHHFIGTLNDNMADRNAKQRQYKPKGVLHNMHKLTEAQVLSIFHGEGSARVLAEKYGVSRSAIKAIRTGRTWPHITSRELAA